MAIRSINYTSKFKKDLKKVKKQQRKCDVLAEVIRQLVAEIPLSAKFRDHKLSGNYDGRRECHIEPDLLLIYCVHDKELTLERLGSHSELFK